jgi:hypothetical protein
MLGADASGASRNFRFVASRVVLGFFREVVDATQATAKLGMKSTRVAKQNFVMADSDGDTEMVIHKVCYCRPLTCNSKTSSDGSLRMIFEICVGDVDVMAE